MTGLTFREMFGISIHAPREGRDGNVANKIPVIKISIHAPREGRDLSSDLR